MRSHSYPQHPPQILEEKVRVIRSKFQRHAILGPLLVDKPTTTTRLRTTTKTYSFPSFTKTTTATVAPRLLVGLNRLYRFPPSITFRMVRVYRDRSWAPKTSFRCWWRPWRTMTFQPITRGWNRCGSLPLTRPNLSFRTTGPVSGKKMCLEPKSKNWTKCSHSVLTNCNRNGLCRQNLLNHARKPPESFQRPFTEWPWMERRGQSKLPSIESEEMMAGSPPR